MFRVQGGVFYFWIMPAVRGHKLRVVPRGRVPPSTAQAELEVMLSQPSSRSKAIIIVRILGIVIATGIIVIVMWFRISG